MSSRFEFAERVCRPGHIVSCDANMSDQFVMCPPAFFDVQYVINPWMSSNVHRVNPALAREQWDNLHTLISSTATVRLIEAEPDLPDMVFTANAGLVVGDVITLSTFRCAERRPEETHFAHWFSHHGFEVRQLPANTWFEGAGDALLDRERGCLWMGFGHRTTRNAAEHLQRLLGIEVVPLELADPRFYHLDTCFCPLPGNYVLFYPGAFTAPSLSLITQLIPEDKLIIADEDDATRFCCNAVTIGKEIILNTVSDALVTTLSQAGFTVRRLQLSEFLRAGGASKCLTLRLEPPLEQAPHLQM